MNSIPDESGAADDIFANNSAETVIENTDFSCLLERANVLTDLNLTKNSDENKLGHVMTVKGSGLHEACPRTVMEAVQRESYIRKEIVAADISVAANQVATKVCNLPLQLQCPFCCSDLTSESQLKGHIRNEHASELGRILVDSNATFLHSCRLCHASFHSDKSVTKHVAEYHHDYIVTMFQEEEPNKYIICRFCPYLVLTEHKKHLLAHIKENHFKEFKLFIDQKFSLTAQCKQLQHTLDVESSNIPNLNTLLTQMSIKENGGNKGRVDQSECSSMSQLTNQNENQLSHEDGNFFDERKVSGIKNVGPRSNLPVRRKLRFDVPDVPEFEKFNKENIISCSTNMKPALKCISVSSKHKPISTWRSVFSFRRKKMNRRKPVSKFSTSTPNTFDLEICITKTQYDEHNVVIKKKGEAKVKLISSIKGEKCASKMHSVTNVDGAPQVHSKDVANVISEKSYPALLEKRGDSLCRWTPSVNRLKQFECAICHNGFVNNIDLLTHTIQEHTGPLKLLQPSYKCGQCAAKFYKNSYLVKHCRFHHTP